jgi:predicted metal-dependent phosphoesterase TrpH
MVRVASKIGLDALALTDHDTIAGIPEARSATKKYGILLIPGAEISTASGHMLALGIQEPIKRGLPVEETLDAIHAQGGIGIASHPFDVKNEGIGKLAIHCDAMEVFNAINLERISNWKAALFASKHKLKTVAASDAHCAAMLGYGCTEIRAERDLDAVLRAIAKGRTTLYTQYVPTKLIMDWAVARLKASYAQILSYINANYRWPKRYVCKKLLALVEKSPGKIDYLFHILAYLGLGSVFVYKAIRETFRMD